ncbi:ATP-binding protein [Sulfurihydrogenibium sp.]|uniref:ATP-binding protein n=1 Tax=Sulfurihydrogenibium sp. TaxID=2053621 RepID=UPI002621A9D2|nr:ATP-binding protein [Sulfurihydrogenibium sp.]
MSFIPFFLFSINRYSNFFYGFVFIEMIVSSFNPNLSLGLILIFFSFIEIVKYIEKIEEEKEVFKLNLAKTIDSEIKREYEKLELKLQTAYKKLKELFKLNSYIVKEISLDNMAEKVVEGLVNLGYSGSFIILNNGEIQKKEGFFPNYKIYINTQISTVSVFEDNKVVLIPLIGENENMGMIGIYSSTPLTHEEIEFLMTYANTISTSIAKTNFLLEKIKLRDLVQKTIESIDIGIIVLNQKFEIELINNSAKNMLKKEDESGDVFDTIRIFKDLEEDLKSIINHRKSFDIKLTVSENPKKVWEIKAFPIVGQNNNVENIVLILEDITKKEEMENQILQSEKLAVIGRLVAGISHEVRNPLAIINQSAYSLKRKILKLLKDNSAEYLEIIGRIERNVARANDIVERLLNFTKPYYSKVETVNIKEVIEESINLASLQAKRSNVNISKKLKDAYIKGDKNSLVQLFINLFINAIEAIEDSGNVDVKVLVNKKEKKVIIKVKDNGIGIPSQHLDKIFEPFFTTKEKGTGLGLSVSYRIVESHGGKIYVSSEEGKGTEFTIEFPLYNEETDGK